MKYSRGQFTQAYYQLWQMNLLLPDPSAARICSVKFRKNHFDEYSRASLKAQSISDALERGLLRDYLFKTVPSGVTVANAVEVGA